MTQGQRLQIAVAPNWAAMLNHVAQIWVCAAIWHTAAASVPIWLIGQQPFSGGLWDAGISMRFGAEIMVEEVNKHPDILPGYELKIAWQDDMCSESVAKSLFLRNLFDEEYPVFAPGVAVGDLDANGDGTITHAEISPLTQVWNNSVVTTQPVGFMGGGCTSATAPLVPIAYAARLPIVSNCATFPELSDREKYPNFFRTVMPETKYIAAWFALLKVLGMRSVVAVIGDPAWRRGDAEVFTAEAAKSGIVAVGDDLADKFGFPFRGILLESDEVYAAKSVANALVKYRQRIVFSFHYTFRTAMYVCEALKAGYMNYALFKAGWDPEGFWNTPGIRCSAEEMDRQAVGWIYATLNLKPTDSSSSMGCSQNMTSGEFMEEWWDKHGGTPGDLSPRPEGFFPTYCAVPTADAVCMYAMALHQVLIEEGLPLTELTARTPRGYDMMFGKLSNMDFQGISSRVRFTPGQSDVDGSIVLQQLRRREDSTWWRFEFAIFAEQQLTFLGKGNLEFHFPGEVFPAGPAGASTISGHLTQFKECPKLTNFATNECMDCPANTEHVQVAGSCLCIAGYYLNSTGGCSPCEGGSISEVSGSTMCQSCKAGTYAGPASTMCTFCAVGTFANTSGMSECTSCPKLSCNFRFQHFADCMFCMFLCCML